MPTNNYDVRQLLPCDMVAVRRLLCDTRDTAKSKLIDEPLLCQPTTSISTRVPIGSFRMRLYFFALTNFVGYRFYCAHLLSFTACRQSALGTQIDLSSGRKYVEASIQAHTPIYTRYIDELQTNGNMENDLKCKRQYNPIDERQNATNRITVYTISEKRNDDSIPYVCPIR